jgi:hypothetical protein
VLFRSNLTQVWTGSPLSPTVTTTPAGLSFSSTGYPQTAVGDYPVTATITDPNYSGTVSDIFHITKAPATIAFSNLTQVWTGSPLSPTVTTTPAGLTYTFTGYPQTAVGSYPVTATITDPNYSGTVSGTFVITKAPATIAFSNLTQAYTGSPLSPTVTTTPAGLTYSFTGYPQTQPGSYPVTATITDPNYTGTASATFIITAPGNARITGTLDGNGQEGGVRFIDVRFLNTGTTNAENVTITGVSLRITAGSAGATITLTNSLPIVLGTLESNSNHQGGGDVAKVVRFFFTTTGTVTRFTIAESGTYTDPGDPTPKAFSASQAAR